MPKTNIRKIIYAVRHKYMTLNSVVVLVAFVIAASWMWGALEMMQRNYSLQREVDAKQRQLLVTQLQRDSLDLQKRYYQTREYQELAVRASLGLVMPGEKTLLHPNSKQEVATDKTAQTVVTTPVATSSNIEQWLNFLFGGNSRSIEKSTK